MAVSVNIEKNFRDFSLKVQFEGSSAAIGLLEHPAAERA